VSAVYATIRDLAMSERASGVIPYDECLARVVHKGFTAADLERCVHEYSQLGVWVLSADKRELRLVT
jgi:hypothetical protein